MNLVDRIRNLAFPRRFQRYTDRARKSVAIANQIAIKHGVACIEDEHLLMAILHEGSGVGVDLLRQRGVDLNTLRAQTTEIVEKKRGNCHPVGKLPLGPSFKIVLEASISEAFSAGDDYVGTEHLVIALAHTGGPDVQRTIAAAGGTPETLRQQLKLSHRLLRAEELCGQADMAGAIAELRSLLADHPDCAAATNQLAWILATHVDVAHRSGPAAVELMLPLCEGSATVQWQYADTLAAAYAEAGQFDLAEQWALKALANVDAAARDICEQRLDHYRNRQPWRE